jgi:hypothetical protein
MTLMRYARLLFTCGAISTAGLNVAMGAERCTTESRLPIVLRLTNVTTAVPIPTAAFLVGNLNPGLRIVDAASGRLLWSAGPAGAYTQRFDDMSAGFTSSVAVLDTDGDGAHDRIYAGDLQGRLWRFDIDTRGPESGWVAGGIFADFSGGASGETRGRGFLAAPDVTLIAPVGMQPWLSIALGTANTSAGPALPGIPRNLNRFYVVRDRAPFTRWTQVQYDRWRPFTEADLLLAEGAQPGALNSAGFYINLGTRQVVAPALTLNGNTFYTAAATGASLLPSCNAPTTAMAASLDVGSVSAVNGSLNSQHLGAGDIRSVPANAAITLVRNQDKTGGFNCEVAGITVPGCSMGSSLRRSFWRREDAD